MTVTARAGLLEEQGMSEKQVSSEKKARFWALVPVGLLGSMVTGLLVMARIASNDPAFALEKDYYAKAVRYDDQLTQHARNEALGWRAAIAHVESGEQRSRVLLELKDGAGLPITRGHVRVEALENARAAQAHVLPVTALEAGQYELELPAHAIGIWELRVSVARGAELFTQSLRVEFELPKPKAARP